jgi:hypothetical protein
MCFINTSWDSFCVFAVMGAVKSTHVEAHFVSSLAWELGVWSTHVEMDLVSSQFKVHFVSLLACGVFGHHKWRYSLCPRWHVLGLVNTSWDAFSVLVGIGRFFSDIRKVLSTQVEVHFVSTLAWDMGLDKTFWDILSVFAGIGGVWLTLVKIHFVSSLVCNGFGQHMLRYILCSRWHGMWLANTCWDMFRVIAGKGGVWSILVEMQFGPRGQGFGHMLRNVFSFRWHGRDLVNTS